MPVTNTQSSVEAKRRHQRLIRILRAAIGIGILAEIGLLVYTPDTSAIWSKLTTRQPERFTELYFAEPTALPKQAQANQPNTFTYRIVNHEAGLTSYHAYVTLHENGIAKQIQTDNPVIAAGGSRNLQVSFTPAAKGEQLEIEITLPAQHQTIHFKSQS